MVTTTSASANRQSIEFDNFTFMALPPDTYLSFSIPSSSIAEDAGGTISIAVEIHNLSLLKFIIIL